MSINLIKQPNCVAQQSPHGFYQQIFLQVEVAFNSISHKANFVADFKFTTFHCVPPSNQFTTYLNYKSLNSSSATSLLLTVSFSLNTRKRAYTSHSTHCSHFPNH